MRIFVGLSGGVDSSVAALRLRDAGHDVAGVFIRTWHPDFLHCTEEADRLDAMRVAAKLRIPFFTLDARDVYKKDVAEYMIEEYRRGNTPNPDVMCNRSVKFGALWEFAKEHGADAIATGHYAQIEEAGGSHILCEAVDAEKDQSYFLWTLTRDDLAHVCFPIGDSIKSDVRKEAAAAELLTASKRDSQGVCFLGKVDMKEFLSHYIERKEGRVVDESGTSIGTHDGAHFYTVGQRYGFTINGNRSSAPHYIIKKDIEKNTLTVSVTRPHAVDAIVLRNVNVLSAIDSETLRREIEVEVRTRYRQKKVRALLKMVDSLYSITYLETADAPAAGQSCVFYLGKQCLGGGIIE